MDIERLKKNLEGRGFTFKYFETGAEASDYLAEQMAGKTVGIGGSMTVETIGLYNKLLDKAADVAWHWKTEPNEAKERAAKAEVYVSSANGIAETGEIINIDGAGNRVASNLYGHGKVYIVAGVNKVCPDVESAFQRARNVAAPKNARRFGKNTPCVTGELRCYDCRSPERICRGVSMLMEPMMGMPVEVVIINEELGY
ncbi:MAG TPA: lactate utilization protein [Candidatus Scatomorpha pullistercoris]|uniref:Lactate utilization protein n=1 Tax=Candidatus Scatomorpha pullistercoris TaxID=2840929 RepID=A0A9D1K7F2_9FIRM|nr:lactate utilization protein [Candidatus Scatomorpha pullistercoris]